ncbi:MULTISPECIES: sensor histidine kinase [unclassified Nonomuraea]|uniref:sensor histidine kinase n=1 Tax=unclassified Nonomuraea TaxID=2593643 RepID=UPI001378BB3E|nr:MULTISPECIES: histidine kinase [unclassified Nonomuraea]NBE99032.1 hypothetical protein [Nonomuraea sp. K271]
MAQDLHDFIAHDLTGMVAQAQAQAARFARADDLDHLRDALERIERVGVSALDAMDGFVRVLHEGDSAPRSMRRISDIPALVDRFSAERGSGSSAQIEIDGGVQTTSRETEATAYRIVVEALTNVRRHAPAGCNSPYPCRANRIARSPSWFSTTPTPPRRRTGIVARMAAPDCPC